jgi:gluconokinase
VESIKINNKNVKNGVGSATALLHDVNSVIDLMMCELSEKGVHEIITIGFSSFVMNLIGVDNDNKPLTDVLTYSASGKTYTHIVDDITNLNHYNNTGTVLNHPCYAYMQLSNIKCNDIAIYSQVMKWKSIGCFIVDEWCSTSNCPISMSEAAWTGMFDMHTNDWNHNVLQMLDLPNHKLPTVSLHSHLNLSDFSLSPSYLKRWPQLRSAGIVLALADGLGAHIGSNCSQLSLGNATQNLSVTVGTSAAVRYQVSYDTDLLENDKRGAIDLWKYKIDRNTLLIGGALTDGGSLLDWFVKISGKTKFGKIISQLSKHYESEMFLNDVSSLSIPIVLPFLSGERCTGWRYDATGCISGIKSSTSPESFVMSLMEGTFMRMNEIIKSIERATNSRCNNTKMCIVASGALLESTMLWRQMLADITGYTVIVLNKELNGETTSFGTACHIVRELSFTQEITRTRDLAQNDDTLQWGIIPSQIDSICFPRCQFTNYYKIRSNTYNMFYNIASAAQL